MAACADLLHPLYRLMVKDVLASKVVHTDDTVVPVQDKTRTKTRQGRAWVYVGDPDHPYTVFDFTPIPRIVREPRGAVDGLFGTPASEYRLRR